MSTRRQLVCALIAALASLGASYRTPNFVVEAPTPQVAQQIGQTAERYRKEKAIEWLGREMPPWPEPCPLKATITMGGAGGATSFAFDRGRVLGQQMHIEGSLERLLASVLPHEVTHTVFAFYFRTPLPRWADEGGAVLSEDDIERNRHDMLCRQILNSPGRAIPLRRLFALKDYPSDVMALYAQGFSVANFLVSSSNRQVFLAFVAQGMSAQGWDAAVQTHYRYRSVEELEQAWLTHLRNTKRQPVELAQNTQPPAATATGRVVVRQTVPPAQPQLAPVVRGQSTEADNDSNGSRPGYLPSYNPATAPRPSLTAAVPAAPRDAWQPALPPAVPPSVHLGAPQPIPQQSMPSAPPPAFSPVGYPR